jgi:hypothetical protein
MSKSGFEPLTNGFSIQHSTTELYRQKIHFKGLEPLTYNLEGYCSSH